MISASLFTFPNADTIKKSFPKSNFLNDQFLNRKGIIDSLAKTLQYQTRTLKELKLIIQDIVVEKDSRSMVSIILIHNLTEALIKISQIKNQE